MLNCYVFLIIFDLDVSGVVVLLRGYFLVFLLLLFLMILYYALLIINENFDNKKYDLEDEVYIVVEVVFEEVNN